MALRKLVEGECGGANSLVNLTSHFVQDRGLKDETFHGFSHSDHIASANSDQLVQEFLEETMGQTAQPFRMDSLLAEMRDLEGKMGPVRSPPVSQLTREEDVQEWAQQYLDAGKHFDAAEPGIWTTDQPSSLNSNLRGSTEDIEDNLDLGIGPKWAVEFQLSQEPDNDEPALGDLSNSVEYVDTSNDLKEIASGILKATEGDVKFTDSKFMKYMHQLSENEDHTGETSSSQTEQFEEDPEMVWASEFQKTLDKLGVDDAALEDTFKHAIGLNKTDEIKDGNTTKHETDFFLWKKLMNTQWEQLLQDSESENWTSEFADFSGSFKEYKFSMDNPMQDLTNPLEEGQKRLEAGELPSAVLCFEAAVAKEPENALAWQLLGSTQAQNEQDPQAITALKKCIQLDPSNLTALMNLAVCYTNENYQNQACRALKEWLKMNERYSDLVPAEPNPHDNTFLGITSLLSRELHDDVKEMYLAAARRNPTDTIDPDVQCGLGVLYNLSTETEKAADCFKSALQVRPNDARMWNRLGATLANGSRSEEAVDAYRSALQLTPGFIRARYNLGITCIHLGAHQEAAEHLLIALNQQASGRGPQGTVAVQMSDSIWNTLRLVIASLLERPDLIDALNRRDLDKLNKEFGID